jgi:hypothetical protein
VAKDVGSTLGFVVRATDAVGTTTAYTSLVGPVAPSAAALVSTAQPAITPTPATASTFQVSNGGWSRTPEAFTYQWLRCNANGRVCVPIPGATANTYTATAADSGHALVAVVGAASGDATQTTLSAAVRAP